MAGSSNLGGEKLDLRFSSRFCDCGRRVEIRVVERDEKPSKGKLYYCCATGNCRVWGWFYPDSAKIIGSGRPLVESKGRLVVDEFGGRIGLDSEVMEMMGDLKDAIADLKNTTKARLDDHEAKLSKMKVLVQIMIGIVMVFVFISVVI